ncbi:hypothetical protein YC2023_035852 [Brassica napus]
MDQKAGQWLFRSYRNGAGIVELMDQLFSLPYMGSSSSVRSQTTSVYDALMSAYMYNATGLLRSASQFLEISGGKRIVLCSDHCDL